VEPYFMMLENDSWISKFSNRGQTIHDIMCHIQDIPENGADIFHFKYIHRYLIGKYKMLEVAWTPKWKRGDDPDLADLFEHRDKSIRAFKQNIYNTIVKPIENKQYYSFANVDNYLVVPIIGHIFVFNLTIIQIGPGIVNIFLKTKFF
jgi:cholesterol 7-dehydrogenase